LEKIPQIDLLMVQLNYNWVDR